MTRIPDTKTVVSYAYTVKIGATIVGTLQGFSVNESRLLDRVREINAGSVVGGNTEDVFEILPGRGEITLTIDKFELFDLTKNIGTMIGQSASQPQLTDLTNSFQIDEVLSKSNAPAFRTISYMGCWVQGKTKAVREGTITVAENVTVWPTHIIITNG